MKDSNDSTRRINRRGMIKGTAA
ncbi:uncharacterized protein METZ01_LOCUS303390, partial [marine metagenome]